MTGLFIYLWLLHDSYVFEGAGGSHEIQGRCDEAERIAACDKLTVIQVDEDQPIAHYLPSARRRMMMTPHCMRWQNT